MTDGGVVVGGLAHGADADDDVPMDPLALAARWLPAPGSGVTPTMTLSTIGLDGYPAARTVLMSLFDGRRVHFHTDSRSRKAAEIAAVPRATVTLVWPELARQLVVTGDVERVTDREARDAYTARSRYLQVLAWLNDDDLAAVESDHRRTRWAAFDADRPDLDPPTTWAGYAITPVRMVFWRGAADAPSNRLRYDRTDAGWTVARAAG
ncbi:pyridoxamine 5'-phosphate oxidase family protein [Curtobacterium sp. MCBD17_035]|uniref:pyridoxine/pyridoxamine 5'-phosphate oxidase n=1 Tax=Curtobacterium sp. MCBD17_035 TaxID=2175673 RepID=UPI001C647D92|nr:pyridoxamine 5'-phosphate oxidase family protein [Curtobacterium sp. MCBD17_035]WIB68942.1 pyridoxamine 5'-phosphate oxidase family protein [Curtobacterium sp. MCBD17_035]